MKPQNKRKPTVFISHAAADRDLVDYLARDLAALGVQTFSDSSIQPGQDWSDAITKALDEAEFFVLVLSPRSLRSEWVNFEAGVALSKTAISGRRVIIPLLAPGLARDAVPAQFRGMQALEMEGTGIAEASRRAAVAIAKAVKRKIDTNE